MHENRSAYGLGGPSAQVLYEPAARSCFNLRCVRAVREIVELIGRGWSRAGERITIPHELQAR